MTGQPNAMGGREVGGLANMLAAHLELDQAEHRQLVQDFWQSPYIADRAGLKAIDLFHAVEQQKIKAIWIIATNPVMSLPDADQVKRALQQCEFVVVSDVCHSTDTTAYADVLLPALAWGEREGTVTNSERRISRQRAFLNAPEQAKADWWAICQVAQRLGFTGFDFNNSHEIFLEHATLSSIQNADLSHRAEAPHFRYFNLKGLSELSLAEYNALQPTQWPVWEQQQSAAVAQHIYAKGQFSHANGKAKFIGTPMIDPVHPPSEAYPFILNTGRIRDQWHSMSRTGLSANLSSHCTEPYCEIHPQDALKYGVREAALLQVKSAWGSCVLRVIYSENIRRGQVFVPMHWNDQFASDARIGKVVNPAVDAISGEPEFKHTPVMIQPFVTAWQGVLFIRHGFEQLVQAFIDQSLCWSKIKTAHAVRYELADRRKLSQINAQLKCLLAFPESSFEWLSLDDASSEVSHRVVLFAGQLIACLYIAPALLLPDRDWIATLFKRQRLSAMHRKALLAGQPMSLSQAQGPLVCSCFKVGKNRIIEVIQSQHITDETQITACLKAGGNCGSCLPEIRGLIKAYQSAGMQ